MEDIVRNIPHSMRNAVSEKLIDIILKSPNASKMPSSLAKAILLHWQRDELATEVGLQHLIEASAIMEPEKVASSMEELGLSEIVVKLKEKLK
ncbi:MAG: hypothetical protein QXJ63_01695 [Candidatus Bathyarchaeia archaeon]